LKGSSRNVFFSHGPFRWTVLEGAAPPLGYTPGWRVPTLAYTKLEL